MKTFSIFENIHLHVFTEERFKSDYISFDFLMPSSFCTPDIATLLAPVLSLCTKNYPTPRLFRQAMEDRYNTCLSARQFYIGETSVLSINASWIQDLYLPEPLGNEPLELLFEMMFHPLTDQDSFSEFYTEMEKKNRLDDIRSLKNNKERLAIKRCLSFFCEKEEYIRTSTEEETARLNGKILYDYYQKLLLNAPLEIFYFGNRNPEELSRYLKEQLSFLNHQKLALQGDAISPLKKETAIITEYEDVIQSRLCMGFKTNIIPKKSPLFVPYLLFKELFIDSPTGRLFMNIREKESLFYSCSGFSEAGKGLLLLSFGIDEEDGEATKNATLHELSEVAMGHFDLSELQNAVHSLQNFYKEMKDQPPMIENFYLKQFIRKDPTSLEERISSFAAVTKDQLMEAAASLHLDTVYLMLPNKRREMNK